MMSFDDVLPIGLFAGDDVEHGFAHPSQNRKRTLLNRVQWVPVEVCSLIQQAVVSTGAQSPVGLDLQV